MCQLSYFPFTVSSVWSQLDNKERVDSECIKSRCCYLKRMLMFTYLIFMNDKIKSIGIRCLLTRKLIIRPAYLALVETKLRQLLLSFLSAIKIVACVNGLQII